MYRHSLRINDGKTRANAFENSATNDELVDAHAHCIKSDRIRRSPLVDVQIEKSLVFMPIGLCPYQDNYPLGNNPPENDPQGQLPPRTITPRKITPRGQLPPRTTTPEDNYPRGQLPPGTITPPPPLRGQ